MGRKKKENVVVMSPDEFEDVVKGHAKEIESDPKYSLEVDPTDKYMMDDTQKKFVEIYCDVKNVIITCQMMHIPEDYGMQLFSMYAVKKEIERINIAKLHRRINTKMFDYAQLGGYLTTLLTEENVPLAEHLTVKDKLQVVDRLLEINKTLSEVANKPIEAKPLEIEEHLKELSVDAIKALLEKDDEHEEKKKLIDKIKASTDVSIEEEAFLKTMSLKELLSLLNQNGD